LAAFKIQHLKVGYTVGASNGSASISKTENGEAAV